MTSFNYYITRDKIKKLGFIFIRQRKGSHEIRYNKSLNSTTILPFHGKKDLKSGTLNSIIKSTGLTKEQFSKI